jgi:hypothetical protein
MTYFERGIMVEGSFKITPITLSLTMSSGLLFIQVPLDHSPRVPLILLVDSEGHVRFRSRFDRPQPVTLILIN